MDRSPQLLSRRQFVQSVGAWGLGLVAGCGRWPWSAPSRITTHRIGFLSASGWQPYFEALLWGFQDLGYVEGRDLFVEWRLMGGSLDGLRDAANELVTMPVSVIVVPGEPPARVISDISKSTPIVMMRSEDPVGQGVVASLARPGGTITGLTVMGVTLAQKRLELLKETVPDISRVAVLWESSNPVHQRALGEVEKAAGTIGLEVQALEIRTPLDFGGAFEAAVREHAEAMLVIPAPVVSTHRTEIVRYIGQHGLATMVQEREWVTAGALMAYGPNAEALARRAASYVDKILKGTSPAELPIEQPTTFDFVINLKTARALGLTIPQHVLLQATEVIQ